MLDVPALWSLVQIGKRRGRYTSAGRDDPQTCNMLKGDTRAEREAADVGPPPVPAEMSTMALWDRAVRARRRGPAEG